MRLRAFLEENSSSNVSEATLQLVKALDVPVTATTVIERVESHPDFPSLYSISDNLSSWKVENAAFQVDAEKLDELPVPFIAHTRKGGSTFVLVQQVNGSVDIINEKGRRETLSREAFLKSWTNTVLLAEKSAGSGELNYQKQRQRETISNLRLPLIAGGCLLFAVVYGLLFSDALPGTLSSVLLLLKLGGSFVTSLLLWFEIDKKNPLLQQICTGQKNTNCKAVLESKAAKLFGWLNWSEIGFFYFAGGFLAILFTPFAQGSSFSALALLNLTALPYTVFSVFYQWRVAKQWCPLCLVVQALLILEFAVFMLAIGTHQLSVLKAFLANSRFC